jgi:hypothetical protein
VLAPSQVMTLGACYEIWRCTVLALVCLEALPRVLRHRRSGGVRTILASSSPSFLHPPIDWRQVGDNAEFACSRVTAVERLLHEMLASVDRNIIRPIRVSLKNRGKIVCAPLASFKLSHPLLCLFLHLLSWGSADALALLVDVARVREVAATAEASRVTMVLAVETSAQEAIAEWDSIALHVKDAEDQAALEEREAWERVSRVEAENTTALASTDEDAEGLVRRIALLEGGLVEAR